MNNKIGILLINIGTPTAPTETATKKFLAEFFSDPYVIDYPKWLWRLILNGIILRVRPAKSARLYASIWDEKGSPLLWITRSIQEKLSAANPSFCISVGMRYGTPSIRSAMIDLKNSGVEHLVIFPLYPQFSTTTSLTAVEHTKKQIDSGIDFPIVKVIEDYHQHPAYIQALAERIKQEWQVSGQPQKILFSFHNVPLRYITKKRDPYQDQCRSTAELVAKQLRLKPSEFVITYQSRVKFDQWLSPTTDDILVELGSRKCESLNVVCPGFAADCLETLEEIAIRGKELYQAAGGLNFQYIPALNDHDLHIHALKKIISEALEI